jgi:DNA-binding SARP family transcriptional activator
VPSPVAPSPGGPPSQSGGPSPSAASPVAPAPVAPAPVAPAPVAPAPVEPVPMPAEVAASPAAPASGARGTSSGARTGADAAPGTVSCVLPGMVVGPSIAAGVAAALGRARLRRRRRRRAAPPAAGLYRHDPYAGNVTRRLERFARGKGAAAGGAGLAAPGLAALVAGERDGAEVAVDLAETQGLVLHGPGAAGAARAAVIGVLATRDPTSAVAMVVGDLLPAAPPFPGLVQAPELEMVLEELTSEVARRAKMLVEEGVPDVDAYRQRRPDVAMPLTLVAVRDVDDADLGALRALFDEGARVGVSGVVVAGAPDGGPVVEVGAGGQVGGAGAGAGVDGDAAGDAAGPLGGARLFSVEPDVASELLAVLAAARTDGDHMTQARDDDDSFVPATSSATAPVAVQLLGAYRIEVEGTEIRSGLRAKAKELLAFYLLHPEGASLDDCIEALWPEADPKRGSEWFWTALGNLRTKLRQATGQKELKIVDRDGDLYRIEDVFDVDLWSLQHALKEGTDTKDETVRLAALDRAVADYSGDLLAGADWFWLETPREDLRQRVVDVLVWLGDRRWATGDARGAWAALQRALEVDPFAEQIYRRVMRLQAKLSRPDDADATYRRLQAKLLEIDLQPTPESDKLHAEVCNRP